jgi:type IV pilus assembly protein PilO
MRIGIRELIFLSVVMGIMGGAYFFVFKPATEKRARLTTSIRAGQKELSDLRVATANVSDVERKIQELEQAIKFFEDKLPEQRELDTIVRDMSLKAERASLKTEHFKTLKLEKNAGYTELPIELHLSGDFHSFYAFLLELEQLKRITKLKSMKLDKIMDRDGSMQAQMVLSVFFESGQKI